jgi:hypothetical protein
MSQHARNSGLCGVKLDRGIAQSDPDVFHTLSLGMGESVLDKLFDDCIHSYIPSSTR